MKNHINKFFIAAVLVAFVLTSCTDEEEIIKGSTKTNSKNNKVLVTEKQPYYQSYSTYDICGVAPAKYVSSDQEIFLSISSIDLCKMKNWTLLQALLNSIIFQAN